LHEMFSPGLLTSCFTLVAIFVGLLFWGWVWDVWGMLLAVPMLMITKAVCDHVEDLKSVGELLGE
jgi:predicted PurR-regulated permease PerM